MLHIDGFSLLVGLAIMHNRCHCCCCSIPAAVVVLGVKSQGWLSRARHRRFFPRRARTDAAAAAAVAVYPSTISGIQFRGYVSVPLLAWRLVSNSFAFIITLLIIYSLFFFLL